MLEAGTLWELVEARSALSPDDLMVVDEHGNRLSFGGYREAATAAAAGLAAMGVGEGSVVSWMLPTWLESFVLVGALGRLGALQNPIIPIYRSREVAFIARQASVDLIVVPSTWRGYDYGQMAREVAAGIEGGPEVLVVDRDLPTGDPASLPPFSPPPGPSAPRSPNPGPSAPRSPTPGPRLPAALVAREGTPGLEGARWLFYTSGTTAEPKGALHSDHTIMSVAKGMADCLGFGPDDRNALVFPFTHIAGPIWLFTSLLTGGSNIIMERFDPDGAPRVLAREGVTMAGSGTAFHQAYLAAQAASPAGRIFEHLRACPGGGAPKPPRLHYQVKEELGGLGVLSGWGLTEAPILTMGRHDDPDEKLASTEGRPMPGVELRVVLNDGSTAKPGEEGELRAKAPQLMLGYLDHSLDADAFDGDGFFRTGDLGVLDEDGYVVVTGRLKDVIIRNGENISAKEVEDLLFDHPSIADVAVVGMPDARTGERACAVVVMAGGAAPLGLEEIRDYLSSKGLRLQAIPEQVEHLDALPRNPAGKVLKHELRSRYSASAAPGTPSPGTPQPATGSSGVSTSTTSPSGSAGMTGRFVSVVAVVTGAASGIGRATAARLHAEGASVACLDLSEEGLSETLSGISDASAGDYGEASKRLLAIRCDVSDERSVSEAVESARAQLGRPSVVCNVAGIGGFDNSTELSLERWEKVIGVNLTGTFLVCRACLPYLLDGGGAIVNVASTAGLMGQAYSAAYCASKGGVVMLTKALAVEYVGRGVRVNAVSPGGVDTPLLGSFGLPADADGKHLYRLMSPMGYATPDQIAAAIAFLASEESGYTTGSVLAVDGGLTA